MEYSSGGHFSLPMWDNLPQCRDQGEKVQDDHMPARIVMFVYMLSNSLELFSCNMRQNISSKLLPEPVEFCWTFLMCEGLFARCKKLVIFARVDLPGCKWNLQVLIAGGLTCTGSKNYLSVESGKKSVTCKAFFTWKNVENRIQKWHPLQNSTDRKSVV